MLQVLFVQATGDPAMSVSQLRAPAEPVGDSRPTAEGGVRGGFE